MERELAVRLLPLVKSASGRCHSCANQRSFDIPGGPVYHCRAFQVQMSWEQRDSVRGCERWVPFRDVATAGRARHAARNPLFARIIEAEDHLFWQLKQHLDELGLDLKTILLIAQPALASTTDVGWVDTLDTRFDDEEIVPFEDIVEELRALRYDSVCDVIERLAFRREVAPPAYAFGNRR